MRKPLLDAFFKPEAVAVIGASEKAAASAWSWCGICRPVFRGDLPHQPELSGDPGAYRLPRGHGGQGPMDLAVIAIPIREVPGVIKECGQAGIKAAIIISAGGREVGPEGSVIEAPSQRRPAAGSGTWAPTAWG